MRWALVIWALMGLVGYVLYMSNKNTRPKTTFLCLLTLVTHTFFGPIGLLYGYICFSNRKNKLKTMV